MRDNARVTVAGRVVPHHFLDVWEFYRKRNPAVTRSKVVDLILEDWWQNLNTRGHLDTIHTRDEAVNVLTRQANGQTLLDGEVYATAQKEREGGNLNDFDNDEFNNIMGQINKAKNK